MLQSYCEQNTGIEIKIYMCIYKKLIDINTKMFIQYIRK